MVLIAIPGGMGNSATQKSLDKLAMQREKYSPAVICDFETTLVSCFQIAILLALRLVCTLVGFAIGSLCSNVTGCCACCASTVLY